MRVLYRKGDSDIFIEHIQKEPIEIDPEDSDVEIDIGDDYEDLTIDLRIRNNMDSLSTIKNGQRILQAVGMVINQVV